MSSQAKKKNPAANDLKQEEKLIAVMLLDTYKENFQPFSLKKAECLLPLIGGKTRLDNNINYLIQNGMEEIYLFSTYHTSQIRAHLTEERLGEWRAKGCEVHFLFNFKCQSVGEAMRVIDAKGLVRSNFILVTASTLISNIKLSDYLDTHKTVSKLDKNCVMTMICQDRTNDLNTFKDPSFNDQTNTLIIHNNSNRVLHYDRVKVNQMEKKSKQNKYVNLPLELFQNAYRTSKQIVAPDSSQESKQAIRNLPSDIGMQGPRGFTMNSIDHLKTIQHRNDLVEAEIYLCSPYVLHMFTDNFDYDNMTDFVRGVLVEEEVAGYTCYIDIIKKNFRSHYSVSSYYSVINNINNYYFETMKSIQRIELVLNEKERSTYRRSTDRPNVYISENQVKCGTNLQIEKNCVIDSKCKIGNNCELVNCYIGSNCTIGDNVKLSNCIIWPNTQIGNNSKLNADFLGFNVKIGNDVNICENCLIAGECHVKDGSVLTERGVYSLRSDIASKKAQQPATTPSSLSITEDNFTKYYLNNHMVDDNDTDDDFGSIDSDQEFDDASTVESENEEANDTGKNYHFMVWKSRSKKTDVKNSLLRRATNVDSDNDSDKDQSDLSALSSDEYDQDTDPEDYDDYEVDDVTTKIEGTHINDEDHQTFLNETGEILQRGLKQNLNPDNVILEINSCKHANNIQIDDLCYFLTKAILKLPVDLKTQESFNYLTTFQSYVKKSFITLLTNYFTKTRQSQKIFLDSTLDFFVEMKSNESNGVLDAFYVKLLHFLYNDNEFLSEVVIIEWYHEKLMKLSDSSNEEGLAMLKKLEGFIGWLEESDSDDEDDDE